MFFNEELEFIQIRKQPCDSRMQLFHTSQHLQTHRDPICCASVMIELMLENRCAEVETASLVRLSGSQGQLVELCSGDTVSKLNSRLYCIFLSLCLGVEECRVSAGGFILQKAKTILFTANLSRYSACNFTLLVYSH